MEVEAGGNQVRPLPPTLTYTAHRKLLCGQCLGRAVLGTTGQPNQTLTLTQRHSHKQRTQTQTHCLTNCHLAPRNPKHTRTQPASVRSNINMNVNTWLDSDILYYVYVCVECMEPCLQSAVSVICDMLFWMGNSEVATIIKCYVTTSMDICHQRWTLVFSNTNL